MLINEILKEEVSNDIKNKIFIVSASALALDNLIKDKKVDSDVANEYFAKAQDYLINDVLSEGKDN